MQYVWRFWLLLACFVPLESIAYIYEITMMVKNNQENESIFVGLSDFHDKSNASNVNQLQAIENMMSGYAKEKTKVAIEDLSSRNNQGRFSCGHYFVNSRGGILGGLADKAKSLGLDVDNIEFRYCRVTSLGPVLNNLHAPLNTFASVVGTNMRTLFEEVNNTIKEIQAYNDGDAVRKIYGAIIKDVQAQLVRLHLNANINQTVAEYLQQHSTPANRLEFLKKLLTFDSGLLDVKLLHAVAQSHKKSKIVAIAGGSHIVRVCELLEKIGYKKANKTHIAYAKEYDLQRCLGSHILEGSYCVKPRPIDVQELIKAMQ